MISKAIVAGVTHPLPRPGFPFWRRDSPEVWRITRGVPGHRSCTAGWDARAFAQTLCSFNHVFSRKKVEGGEEEEVKKIRKVPLYPVSERSLDHHC